MPHKGNIPWNKDKKYSDEEKQNHKGMYKKGDIPFTKGKHLSKSHRENISLGQKGKPKPEHLGNKYRLGKTPWNKGLKNPYSKETIEKIRQANIGKKKSPETRMKMSVAMLGEKNHNYINGMSKIIVSHYSDLRYNLWRESVFQRDDWTCQGCGVRGGYLEAHHIKSWAIFPELRFELENGQTLCKPCHKLTDNYAGKKMKN